MILNDCRPHTMIVDPTPCPVQEYLGALQPSVLTQDLVQLDTVSI